MHSFALLVFEERESRTFSVHNPLPWTKFRDCYQGYLGRNIFSFGNQREFICVLLTVGNKWDHAALWSRNWIVISCKALAYRLSVCFVFFAVLCWIVLHDHLIASSERWKRRDVYRAAIKDNNIFRGSSTLSKLPYIGKVISISLLPFMQNTEDAPCLYKVGLSGEQTDKFYSVWYKWVN